VTPCALWALSDPPRRTALHFKETPVFTLFVPFELQSEIRFSNDVKYWLLVKLILAAVLAEISEHITVCRLQNLQIFMGTTTTTTKTKTTNERRGETPFALATVMS